MSSRAPLSRSAPALTAVGPGNSARGIDYSMQEDQVSAWERRASDSPAQQSLAAYQYENQGYIVGEPQLQPQQQQHEQHQSPPPQQQYQPPRQQRALEDDQERRRRKAAEAVEQAERRRRFARNQPHCQNPREERSAREHARRALAAREGDRYFACEEGDGSEDEDGAQGGGGGGGWGALPPAADGAAQAMAVARGGQPSGGHPAVSRLALAAESAALASMRQPLTREQEQEAALNVAALGEMRRQRKVAYFTAAPEERLALREAEETAVRREAARKTQLRLHEELQERRASQQAEREAEREEQEEEQEEPEKEDEQDEEDEEDEEEVEDEYEDVEVEEEGEEGGGGRRFSREPDALYAAPSPSVADEASLFGAGAVQGDGGPGSLLQYSLGGSSTMQRQQGASAAGASRHGSGRSGQGRRQARLHVTDRSVSVSAEERAQRRAGAAAALAERRASRAASSSRGAALHQPKPRNIVGKHRGGYGKAADAPGTPGGEGGDRQHRPGMRGEARCGSRSVL
jgi:hypothetical protein